MGITQTLVTYFRNTLTGLRPVRELCIAFGITWYLIYKLPVSGMSCTGMKKHVVSWASLHARLE